MNYKTSLRDIAAELEKSFESKTGSKINETLKKYEKQINNNIFNEHVHLANSCGKNKRRGKTKDSFYCFNLLKEMHCVNARFD